MKSIRALGAKNYNYAKNLLKRKIFIRYCKPRVDLVKEIVAFLDIKGHEKIMDAGCGNGEDLLKLRREYRHRGELYGLDISETMIRHAKKLDQRAQSNIQFIKEI
jgi:ubiquinone/menaquinone biosynthesis C-methylase UbiE